jgi:hypothetical protein
MFIKPGRYDQMAQLILAIHWRFDGYIALQLYKKVLEP